MYILKTVFIQYSQIFKMWSKLEIIFFFFCPGNFVLGVTAVDRDSGPNGKVQYVLIGQDSDNFQLDPINGIITAKTRLTGGSGKTYRFQVRASDMVSSLTGHRQNVRCMFCICLNIVL